MMSSRVIAILLVVAALGCGRGQQCKDLIDAVGTSTKGLDSISATVGGGDVSKHTADAQKQIEGLSAVVSSVALKDDKLRGYQSDYVAVVARYGTAFAAVRAGTQKHDGVAVEKGVRELQAADKDEDIVREQIAKYCKE